MGKNCLRLATLVVCLAAWAPVSAWGDHADPPGCPPSCYPSCHYRFPTLYKLCSCFYCPRPPCETYYSDVYSNIPATYRIQGFPCPTANPAELYTSPTYAAGIENK
jgi:hypothetical protein